jgi:hypothetical protein
MQRRAGEDRRVTFARTLRDRRLERRYEGTTAFITSTAARLHAGMITVETGVLLELQALATLGLAALPEVLRIGLPTLSSAIDRMGSAYRPRSHLQRSEWLRAMPCAM